MSNMEMIHLSTSQLLLLAWTCQLNQPEDDDKIKKNQIEENSLCTRR